MFVQSTFKDDINALLKSGAFYIALGIAIIIVVVLLVIWLSNRKKKK